LGYQLSAVSCQLSALSSQLVSGWLLSSSDFLIADN
jgi:hypothetical protein